MNDKRFKLVIFDLDGTLVDSSNDVVECFNYALKMEGLKPAPDYDIKKTIGYPLQEVLSRYGDSERLYKHFTTLSRQIMGNKTVLLNNVEETLKSLKINGFTVAIATTKTRQNTERVLKLLEIETYISELSCGDDVKNVKPAPDVIIRLLKIHEIKGNEALMVGDTINDIITGRRAGVKSAAVLAGFDSVELIKSENPDWILDDLNGVLEIVLNGTQK